MVPLWYRGPKTVQVWAMVQSIGSILLWLLTVITYTSTITFLFTQLVFVGNEFWQKGIRLITAASNSKKYLSRTCSFQTRCTINKVAKLIGWQPWHAWRNNPGIIFCWKPVVTPNVNRGTYANSPWSSMLDDLPAFEDAFPSIRSIARISSIHHWTIWEEIGFENPVE